MTPQPPSSVPSSLPARPRPEPGSRDFLVPRDPQSLRVVLLCDAIPGRNGGGTYYDDLADHLRNRVQEVLLLGPPADPTEKFPGWTTPLPGDPTQKLYFPSPRRLFQRIREVAPHVIVSGTPGAFGVLGLAMAALHKSALCVGYHTEYSELAGLYWKGNAGRAYKAIMASWDSMMFRFGSKVLVTNEALGELAMKWGAKEVFVMGTPIQRRFLDEPLADVPDQIRTVTFVGRLAPEKRLDQIRDAALAHPSLHFRIAGDGPLRGEVEGWSASLPNLEYVGWLPRDGVMEIMDSTDLLVLPSKFETFGTVAFEAMARQRLVLVSPNCGIAQWPALAPGLFQMEEGEALPEAIRRLLEMDLDERTRAARSGADAAQTMCHQTIDQWVDVLFTAAREKRFV